MKLSEERLTPEYVVRYLEELVKGIENIEGDIVELGTYKGETAADLKAVTSKRVITVDFFEGLPYNEGHFTKGNHRAEFEEVSKFLESKDVVLVKGVIPEILETLTFPVSFVYIDLDLTEYIKKSIDFFADKLSVGGLMAVHDTVSDYLFKAVEESAEKNNLVCERNNYYNITILRRKSVEVVPFIS